MSNRVKNKETAQAVHHKGGCKKLGINPMQAYVRSLIEIEGKEVTLTGNEMGKPKLEQK